MCVVFLLQMFKAELILFTAGFFNLQRRIIFYQVIMSLQPGCAEGTAATHPQTGPDRTGPDRTITQQVDG